MKAVTCLNFDHVRIEYRDRLVSLQRVTKGSTLKYEEPTINYGAWMDLVLRNSRGLELARLRSIAAGKNIYNHFLEGLTE